MASKQLVIRIDKKVKQDLDNFCDEWKLKTSQFVEEAILCKLEEYEDMSDLMKPCAGSLKSLDKVLTELQADRELQGN